MTSRTPLLRFAQFSDTHIRASERLHRGVDTAAALGCAVQAASGIVDFAVHTGDIVSRPADAESYRVYKAIVETLACPLWHIPGNHDVPALMEVELSGFENRLPWHFETAGSHFIGLDTSSGALTTEQLARLSKLLEEKGTGVLFLHHHICRMDESWLNPYALENSDDLYRVVEASTMGIAGIIHGHIHHDAVLEFAGVPVYSAPALTAQFAPYGSHLETTDAPPAFVMFSLLPDGTLSREVLPCGGGYAGEE